MTFVLGPLPCLTCRKVVVWDRIGSQLRLVERAGNTYRRHRHAALCDAWMPSAKERCARGPEHLGSHRSRYAMDNEATQKRAGFAA